VPLWRELAFPLPAAGLTVIVKTSPATLAPPARWPCRWAAGRRACPWG